MPLDWKELPIPFAGGLDTRSDAKAVPVGKLGVCENAVFVTPGQLRKRYGYSAVATSTVAGTMSGAHTVAKRGDQLVAVDRQGLWLVNPTTSGKWIRAHDLAARRGPVCSMSTRAAPKTRQDMTLADRATTSNGITCYVWAAEDGISYISMVEAATGTPVALPANLDPGGLARARVFAFGTTFVFVYAAGGGTLSYFFFDTAVIFADPGNGLLAGEGVQWMGYAGNTLAADLNGTTPVWDAEVSGDQLLVVYNSSTANTIKFGYLSLSRAFSFTIQATAAAPTAVCVSVEATTGRFLLGWAMDSTTTLMAGVWNQDKTVNRAAAAVDAVSTGYKNLCAIAISSTRWQLYYEISAAATYNQQLWLGIFTTTGGAAGSLLLLRHAGIAAKPFKTTYDFYLPVVFESPLQSTYFVCRLETTFVGTVLPQFVARILPGTAGGLTPKAHLCKVETLSTDVVGLALLQRRRVGTGAVAFDRAIMDVTLDFTAGAFSRTEVAGALYMAGAVALEYDGFNCHEQGFLLYPEAVTLAQGAGGSLTALATYSYRVYYEYLNAQGQRELSTALPFNITLTGANGTVTVTVPTLTATMKDDQSASGRAVSLVVFRTAANPSTTPIYYRVSNPSPAVTGTNGYKRNDVSTDTVTFTDQMSDATLITQETDYLSASELDHVAVPAAVAITASKNRVWAALAEDPDVIWPSLLRLSTLDPVSFSDALTVRLPTGPGPLTALVILNDVIIAFRDQRIYMIGGDGPDNTGLNGTFTDARTIAEDIGCMAGQGQSVVRVPNGLMFKSRKGIYMLSQADLSLSYIGEGVEGFNGETITSAVLLADVHQVRFGCASGITLVYDYMAGQWGKFTGVGGLDAVLWRNQYTYLKTSSGDAYKEVAGRFQDADSGGNSNGYAMALETAWIHLAGLQAYQRVRELLFLGDWKSAHTPRVRVAYDYEPGWVDDTSLDISAVVDSSTYGADALYGKFSASVGGVYGGNIGTAALPATSVYQFRHFVRKQKCEAIKVRFEDTKRIDPAGLVDYPWLESCRLNEITMRVGMLPGLMKVGADRSVGG